MSSNPSRTDPLHWLEAVLADDPDRPFVVTDDGTVHSYRAVDARAAGIEAALRERGVDAGDRVVAQIDKSIHALALYLACLRTRAVFVPLNTAYTLAELEYFIADADARLCVVRPQDEASARGIAGPARAVATLAANGTGTLTVNAGARVHRTVRQAAAPHELAALLYTSGTTGRSKGAMLSRANLASNAATLMDAWRFTSADVLLHALPIFHVHGLFVAINTVMAAGASMHFLSRFDAAEVLSRLPRATVLMGVPTFYTRLLQLPGLTRERVRNMRLFVSGSAPLLPETHREFAVRTGHAILERYGMSETLMNTSNPYEGERIPGSVGPALPGIEVRIAAAESGKPLTAPNAVGMIEVRGPNVFSGYWRMPEKTAADFRADGFFITGDLGRIDERGYVFIVGRAKDLVITGGYNVYPSEVESEIDALDGVLESAVIGVPHADFGEAVTAVVVRKPGARVTEEELRTALTLRLAKFKVPKRVVFVDELPRNTMGKVQKSQLRQNYAALYRE
jgi:malonyl-CoA/methylmalonyl-CoA synthetase